VSVIVHNNAEMMDYPTDSQMSGRSSMVQLPHLAGHKSRTVCRLEDSATQTQVEESFFSENKDGAEVVPFKTEFELQLIELTFCFII
jgi:hypothetical protein